MNLTVPSPEALRAKKKKQLLAHLDAQLHLKDLVARLSSGFIEIDEETTVAWAGWIASLQNDEAWPQLRPALAAPEAWPDVWHRARQTRFSPRTEHHQAIFFTRFFERAMEAQRQEKARYAFTEALKSWASLCETDYLETTALGALAKTLTEEQRTQALAGLLDYPLSLLGDEGLRALHLQSWEGPPLRRPLRFVIEALTAAQDTFAPHSESPLATGALEATAVLTETFYRAVTEELKRRLDGFNLPSVTLKELTTCFEGALLRSEVLDHPVEIDRVLLRRGLALIWDLREIGRDAELALLPAMLELLTPVMKRLQAASAEERFGLEGAIADLLVFHGEEAVSLDVRQEAFEEALTICPGHRNASRLLSFLLLERANRDLLKTAALPAASAKVGAVRSRVESLLRRAEEAIKRAETLHPENDLLGRYRTDLHEELHRFELEEEP